VLDAGGQARMQITQVCRRCRSAQPPDVPAMVTWVARAADLAGRAADQDQVLRSLRKLLAAYERCLGVKMEPGEGEQPLGSTARRVHVADSTAAGPHHPCGSSSTARTTGSSQQGSLLAGWVAAISQYRGHSQGNMWCLLHHGVPHSSTAGWHNRQTPHTAAEVRAEILC
jgi:hypothetical protein